MTGWESVCTLGFFVLVFFHLLPWAVMQVWRSWRIFWLADRVDKSTERRKPMSRLWSHNPEFFDEWLTTQALNGRFGDVAKHQAEEGEFEAYQEWTRLDTDGSLSAEATQDYYGRFVR